MPVEMLNRNVYSFYFVKNSYNKIIFYSSAGSFQVFFSIQQRIFDHMQLTKSFHRSLFLEIKRNEIKVS